MLRGGHLLHAYAYGSSNAAAAVKAVKTMRIPN